jgi:hypothetical protein
MLRNYDGFQCSKASFHIGSFTRLQFIGIYKKRKQSDQGGGLQRIVNMRALTIVGPPLNSRCWGIRALERNSSSLRPSGHY